MWLIHEGGFYFCEIFPLISNGNLFSRMTDFKKIVIAAESDIPTESQNSWNCFLISSLTLMQIVRIRFPFFIGGAEKHLNMLLQKEM